jgi:transcriptional regulator with XRE-family HTH domain
MARAIISARSIRTLKKRSGLTDAKLAYFTGVTRETFNKWKNAKQLPSMEHIHQLAALYRKFLSTPLPLLKRK